MIRSITYSCGGNGVDLVGHGGFVLTDIKGVSPSGGVFVAEVAGIDGGFYGGSRSRSRNITMILQFLGGDAEADKYELYKAFPLKKAGELRYTSFLRDLKIDCYVESVDIPPTARPLTAQISLIAPGYYFERVNAEPVVMRGSFPKWEFPWEIPSGGFEFATVKSDVVTQIYNGGEVETGAVFELKARAAVVNPRLENINTFEWFALDFGMIPGDVIRIDTSKGRKSVKLVRGNVTTNIINGRVWGSTFLQLAPGLNEIKCTAESGDGSFDAVCILAEKFGGV